MFMASPQAHAQYVRETESDGITAVFDQEERQNNQVTTLCEWMHSTSMYGA